MLDWLKSWFRSKPTTGEKRMRKLVEANLALRAELLKVKARYDAAVTNDDNRRHWANADGLSAAAANSHSVRATLRNRSRYESDNNGYACGAVRSRADDLVGTGPTLQITSEDDFANESVELTFAEWARAVRLSEKLHVLDQARNRDGEAFAMIATNPGISHPVQLDLIPIEADRISDRMGTDHPVQLPSGGFRSDGIEYDPWGNVVAYDVLDDHPGDLLRAFPLSSQRVPARFMIHWFRLDRPGQLRGVPELTSSLPLFAYLRRWTLATLSAAEIAASFAALLETDAPPDETDPPEPFESLEIERGMMTTLPAGAKARQLESEHPTAAYSEFKREIVAEAARPLRMPVNVAMGDSSRHNFSSAKLDHFNYRAALKVDRAWAGVNVLDRILAEWAAEAVLLGLVPADVLQLPRSWYWPGWPTMDKDEASNVTERLINGTTTLQDELAADGQDWKDRVRQRGRELRLLREEGVPSPAKPSGSTTRTDEEDNDDSGEQVDGTAKLNGRHHALPH